MKISLNMGQAEGLRELLNKFYKARCELGLWDGEIKSNHSYSDAMFSAYRTSIKWGDKSPDEAYISIELDEERT